MNKRTVQIVSATVLLFAAAHVSNAANVDSEPARLEGPARAWDGDTIEIAGYAVRISGIDAPEMRGDARGPVARAHMDDLLAGRTVVCEISGKSHDRLVGTCRAGGRDLGEAMVRQGWAFEHRKYSADYGEAEAEARAEGRGFWESHNSGDGWWEVLERWQTAISALLGFAGLIWVTRQGFKHTIEARLHSATLDHQRDDRQRKKESKALAATLMGDIASLLRIAHFRGYMPYFLWLKELVEGDGDWPKGVGISRTQDYLAAFSQNVARLGLLPGNLPERVTMLYTIFKALLEDFEQLRQGALDESTKEHRLHVLNQTIALLDAAITQGEQLTQELAEVAERPAPVFRLPDDAADTAEGGESPEGAEN